MCSSLYDQRCGDSFKVQPNFSYDCSNDPIRGIIPVQHCRKINYLGNMTARFVANGHYVTHNISS